MNNQLKFLLCTLLLLVIPNRQAKCSTWNDTSLDTTRLIELVNIQRAAGCICKGVYYPPVPPLTWNNQLAKAAQEHCNYMARTHKFSHQGKRGSNPSTRITKAGYVWQICAENIAWGATNEAQLINLWMNSEHHCANMMNKDLKEMGIARKGTYWTQDFGTLSN